MQQVIDVSLVAALAIVCAAGMVLSLLQLPGTWLIVVAVTGYAWYYDWQRIGAYSLGAVALLAALAEVGEALMGVVAARYGGASRRASWYGLIGGIAGALLLTIPIPLVGTVIGAAVGCFGGALLAELLEGRGLNAGARSGTFAAIGRTLGSMLKLLVSLVMSGIALFHAVSSL